MTQNTKPNKQDLEIKKAREEIRVIGDRISALKAQLETEPIKVELKEKEEIPKSAPLSGVIKDELFFISSLILFVGIISTETYYHTFGVKYQFLSLPVFHIVYRGLTAIIDNPILLFPYIIAVTWLILDSFAVKQNWVRFLRFQRPLFYLLILLVLLLTYPLAKQSGRIEAETDLRVETSSLPIIQALDNKSFSEDEIIENQYRLLMIDSNYIIFFKPLKKDEVQSAPIIHRIPKGEVHVLDTN